MTREETVLSFLTEHDIPYTCYNHPEGKTIEEAKRWWRDDGSVHCKNIFMRNHKGNRHYLVVFECHKEMQIHSLEHMLKQGKLSFASAERMERCLGLLPGSVSPLGLIHDPYTEELTKEHFPNGHRVKLFLDKDLKDAERVSFHPCDNTGSVVLSNADFMKFLEIWGGEYEWLDVTAEV